MVAVFFGSQLFRVNLLKRHYIVQYSRIESEYLQECDFHRSLNVAPTIASSIGFTLNNVLIGPRNFPHKPNEISLRGNFVTFAAATSNDLLL